MDEITKVAAEEATKTAGGLMSRLFGPLADGLGLMMSQGIRIRVLENQIRGMKMVKEICERENVKAKAVNLKVVLPYLEGVGLEEEPELEKMWANLMVNYLDPERNLETVVYPSILKQLSTEEIKALGTIYDKRDTVTQQIGKMTITINEIYDDDFKIKLHNLLRLGIIERELNDNYIMGSAASGLGYMFPRKYKLSGFGREFYEACQREKRD